MSIENHKSVNFMRQVRQSPYISKLPEKAKLTTQRNGNELFNEGKKNGTLKNLSNGALMIAPSAILDRGVVLIANKKLEFNDETVDMLFSLVWDAIKK